MRDDQGIDSRKQNLLPITTFETRTDLDLAIWITSLPNVVLLFT